MTDIVDITPPVRYSFAERSAARLNLSKSRFFLVLGLGAQLETGQNPLPATLSSCSRPNVVLKVVRLASKEKFWSRDQNSRILIELKGRQLPKSRIATANRIVSAIGGLFAHVHYTAYHDLAPYQIPKELIRDTELSVEQVEELEAPTGRDPSPFGIRARLGSFVIIPEPPTATRRLGGTVPLRSATMLNCVPLDCSEPDAKVETPSMEHTLQVCLRAD